MQVKAVDNIAEQYRTGGTIHKGQALIDAGYSEVTAQEPSRIFGSPTVLALMDKMGLSERDFAEGHKKLLNMQRGEHMTFPPFNDEEEEIEEDIDDLDSEDEMPNGHTKRRGERMTDAQIRDFIQSFGGTVHRIVHGDAMRHVYYRVPDARALKDALDMGYNLRGSYAPKRVEGKHDHRVGVFSMKELRKKMQKNGVPFIEPK